jgi:phosphoribosylamine---glycine ligase
VKILVVGGGGREHAIAWKAARSPLAERVFVAPGNAGTAREPAARTSRSTLPTSRALADFAAAEDIGLTIVGPEVPLVAGIVDEFTAAA